MPTAIVTGGSRGLGLALIRELSASGWRVVTDARDGHALADATRDLARVAVVPGDIADGRHRHALVEAATDTADRHIDAVVNNASLLGPSPQPHLADYPLDVLARVYAVNVIAPLGLVQAALPHLRVGGVIVNITSDVANESYPGWGGYASSKAALEHLTGTLAAERPDLRVYAADPGDLRTRMHQDAFPGEDISDRPLPAVAVPGLRRLLDGDLASGRYTAQDVGVPA
jgi:NAD(P)-dependent dehydrogenase (short-subunit alcohol dehydrogenase family)